MLWALLVLATPTIGPPPKTRLDNSCGLEPDWLGSVLDESGDPALAGFAAPASCPESLVAPGSVVRVVAAIALRAAWATAPPSTALVPGGPPTAVAADASVAAPAMPRPPPARRTSPTWSSLKSSPVRGSL